MNRREFLTVAGAGVASLSMSKLSFASPPKPKIQIVRVASDRFEMISPTPNSVRILQLTDTHFGRPDADDQATDEQSRKMIRKLLDQERPDFVFHTGDFINNDTENCEHSSIGFMDDLGTPWAMVFGNHDVSEGQPGGISLDDYYARLENCATGFATIQGEREYCYRIDIKSAGKPPVASLFAFNSGGKHIPMVVSARQIEWFREQIESDKSLGLTTPILVMQHIPTIDYKTVFDAQHAVGRRGEDVCFEVDKGDVVKEYVASGRVKGVFCGHDHVNDYVGTQQGIRLVYGRVSGWSGYGDWQRGGRLINVDGSADGFKTKVVLPKGVTEKPEWSKTLSEM